MIATGNGNEFTFKCEFNEERHAIIAIMLTLQGWGEIRCAVVDRLHEGADGTKASKDQPTQDHLGMPPISAQEGDPLPSSRSCGRKIPDDTAHLHQEIFAVLGRELPKTAEAWMSVSDI